MNIQKIPLHTKDEFFLQSRVATLIISIPSYVCPHILIYHFEYVHILMLRYFKDICVKIFKSNPIFKYIMVILSISI